MKTENFNLIYIWDGYCGWCFGFSKELTKFVKNHPELPVTVLPGGLFTGDKTLTISHYSHILGANQRITQLTGVEFGEPYNRLLEEGSFVLNSEDAARGFVALRHFTPTKQYDIANAMMKLFYQEGKSLSKPETFGEIAQNFGLDAQDVMEYYSTDKALEVAKELFNIVQETGINSYPTLLLQNGKDMIKIDGGVATLEKIEHNLEHAKGALASQS
ncbi:DsbA family protein [Gramella sp. MT6]|uniref:DsbA family protein n=1 Tax=Gramella sp. MT6 TaxID=2705471 RepID=UPI001C604ED2|nr:DsbA family protein [Gramella sp. MT6]QYA26915.1 DsbA family protein [Gramella sp. MT6]